MASKIRAHALEGMVTQRGLEISFLDPGGGLDDKVVEVSTELPEFRRSSMALTSTGDDGLKELFSVDEGIPNLKQRRERQRLLCEEFFSDTSKWVDNRLNKETSGRPDFRHKSKNKALWINNWFKPSWVEERLANMADPLPFRNVSSSGPSDLATADVKELEHLRREGQLAKAVDALQSIDKHGVPSHYAYSCVLKACSSRMALSEGMEIHNHLIKNGLELDSVLGGLTVHMFVKCGNFSDGLKVFKKLLHRTAFSWTAVIMGHIELGQAREALNLYNDMQKEGGNVNHLFAQALLTCI